MKLISSLLAIAALLVISTPVRAADKPVPFKVCLTQEQAAQVYKGKRLKYREIKGERCWYAGNTLPKHAFIPRATGVAAKPTRLIQQEHTRVQEPVSSILTAGASSIRTNFTATLEDDAVLALSGKPESSWAFDAYWFEMTGWAR